MRYEPSDVAPYRYVNGRLHRTTISSPASRQLWWRSGAWCLGRFVCSESPSQTETFNLNVEQLGAANADVNYDYDYEN